MDVAKQNQRFLYSENHLDNPRVDTLEKTWFDGTWYDRGAHDKHALIDFPKVSIVIPTHNCFQLISLTLESILFQHYPDFEVLLIDAQSTDRTLEIVKSLGSSKIRVYSVAQLNRYQMLNRGIALAQGEYVNVLFPGDFYICRDTLKYMMQLALDYNKPDLIFCGTLLRNGKSEVKTLFRDLSLSLLKKGMQPTSLQSCWFRIDTMQELGLFDPSYSMRGGFELMCRFCLKGHFRAISTKRVLTDYDLRIVSRRMVVNHFLETLRAVYHHFGFFAALRWLVHQKDITRLFKLWVHTLKMAFTEKG